MPTIFISPYPSSIEWAKTFFPCGGYASSCDRRFLRRLPPSTEIFGQLSIPLAAYACELGHTYYHLVINSSSLPPKAESKSRFSVNLIQRSRPIFIRYHLDLLDTLQPGDFT